MRRSLALLTVLFAFAAAPAASAQPVNLGIFGDMARFQAQTGQQSDTRQIFLGWNQGMTWGWQFEQWFPQLGRMPMIALNTKSRGVEVITPRGIAMGRGDAYLMDLNRELALWGGPAYVRPLAEMNHHNNVYCAYNRDGTRRNAAHSTYWFRKAFRRMYLILHGGSKDVINAKLSAQGLPGIAADLPSIPYPTLRVVWNPQGFGSPNVAGNSAHAYFPGNAYVDVVGNDLYFIRGKAMWAAAQALYDAYPTKPYAFPEWGLWGIDDPGFIRRMASFVRTHPRVEMIAYYMSREGSIFDLGNKPLARAAYRAYITPLG
jgi:hypothetical protein